MEKEVSICIEICEEADNLIFFSKYLDQTTVDLIKEAKDKELNDFINYVPTVSSRWIINTK